MNILEFALRLAESNPLVAVGMGLGLVAYLVGWFFDEDEMGEMMEGASSGQEQKPIHAIAPRIVQANGDWKEVALEMMRQQNVSQRQIYSLVEYLQNRIEQLEGEGKQGNE